MSQRFTRRRFGLSAGALLGAPALGLAKGYPTRPIRMLVGFAPGGPTDILARIVANALGKALDQSIVVDNRSGAGGAVAAQALANSAHDGYTILFAGDGQLTLLPQMSSSIRYVTDRDLAVIRSMAGQSNVLMSNRSTGITDLPSLLRIAKAHPGKLTFGSAGMGTPSHLVGAMFEEAAQVSLLHVPYRGAGPAMVDFMAGQLDLMFAGMPVAVAQAKDQRFAILAVTGRARSPRLPQVPTFAELGVSGLGEETDVWWALTAPAGLPPQVLSRLDAAARAAIADPQLRRAFDEQGIEIVDRDATASLARIHADEARWSRLMKAGKIKRG
ncbi:MAG: tripartite tricarboxylate transporter substrate binding protein [Burkholderiales bacterium]|nr:tripartite tricarboxylate transporter substrate binding protein [Burkholderiales bacterium]MDE1925818.1 tripartite tricarboxylate transporter substrate binding protein [Burkholderiales bacterium]